MKVYVYQAIQGTKLLMFNAPMNSFDPQREYRCIGELDLDIKQEKKVVTKEQTVFFYPDVYSGKVFIQSCWIDANAKNPRLTYEIEE